ncbi:MAG: hypothetical protein L0191_16955 [Acidobacteria bacterium]|nr:hypothetical protein [Acidobacteriota bacterium]
MNRRILLFLCWLPLVAWDPPATSAQGPSPARAWRESGAAFYEELLLTAELVDAAPVGRGGLKPARVYLRRGDQRVEAVFKSILPGLRQGFWESHQAEVAAYELDKLLGLGMVPPTVVRQIEGKTGSLQLWVDGCREWQESAQEPQAVEQNPSISRTKTFDNLIGNWDRERGNILIDPGQNLILIDHSRAFIPEKKLSKSLPVQFDRNLVARMRALDRPQLARALRGMSAEQIQGLLARRDLLLAHLDQLIKEKGEAAVLF